MEAREVPGSLENIPRRSDTNVRFNDRRRIKIIGESKVDKMRKLHGI